MHPTPWLRMWMLVLVLFVLVGMWVWVWVFPPSWGVGAVGSPRFSLPSSLCLGSTGGVLGVSAGGLGAAVVAPFPVRPLTRSPPSSRSPPGAPSGAAWGSPARGVM